MDELEQAHWNGRMEERVDEHDRRLNAINGSIKDNTEATTALTVAVGGMKVRVGIYSTLGASIGGGLVAVIVYLATHGS